MSRVLYFDCFAGISGDMALGALLDAGLPFDELQQALGSLALGETHVHVERVLRANLSATKFSVHDHTGGSIEHTHHDSPHSGGHGATAHRHQHRSLGEIFDLIDRASLSMPAR